MTLPADATVRIAFGVDPWNPLLEFGYTDVTADVRSITWSTSNRSSEFDTFQAGKLVLVLDNRDGTYDPAYTSGTHFGDFRRSTVVRLDLTDLPPAVTYTHGRYFVERWTVEYPENNADSVAVVECIDLLGLCGNYYLDLIVDGDGEPDPSYDNDTVAARLGRVLDDINVLAGFRNIGANGSNARLAPTTWGVNALEHMQRCVESQGGLLYCQRDGVLTHDTIESLATTRQSTSQLTIAGSGAVEYMAGSLKLDAAGDNFRNVVRVSAARRTTKNASGDTVQLSGTIYEVDKRGSALEVPQAKQLIDSELRNDADAEALANFWAQLFATEVPFPNEVTVFVAGPYSASSPYGDVNGDVLALKLRDRVTITQNPPGTPGSRSWDCYIDGIHGRLDQQSLRLTFQLASADAYDDNLDAAPSTWGTWDSGSWWDSGSLKWGYL